MDKNAVAEYFNSLAHDWDSSLIRNEHAIKIILDYAGIKSGVSVLDVACGTGVLVGDYLKRGAAKVVGVDISANMIDKAKAKFPFKEVTFLCADIESVTFDEKFDCCVVYNALPHFADAKVVVRSLKENLKQGARLTIAHGMSKKEIDGMHKGSAKHVSVGLIDENELAQIMSE